MTLSIYHRLLFNRKADHCQLEVWKQFDHSCFLQLSARTQACRQFILPYYSLVIIYMIATFCFGPQIYMYNLKINNSFQALFKTRPIFKKLSICVNHEPGTRYIDTKVFQFLQEDPWPQNKTNTLHDKDAWERITVKCTAILNWQPRNILLVMKQVPVILWFPYFGAWMHIRMLGLSTFCILQFAL